MKDRFKRILLIGDGNHQFITNCVRWLKENEDFKIDVLTFTDISVDNRKIYDNIFSIKTLLLYRLTKSIRVGRRFVRRLKEYKDSKIDVLTFTDISVDNRKKYDNIFSIKTSLLYRLTKSIRVLRRIVHLFLYKRLLNRINIERYDCVHFHFISEESCLLSNIIRQKTKEKIIFTIWGSDFYKLTDENKEKFIQACKNADTITFTNIKTEEKFKTDFNWNKDNTHICRFGLQPLTYLENLTLTKVECKNKLGWNAHKLAIAIGYNMNPQQQHLAVLNIVRNLDNVLKDAVQIILPITYGGSDVYKLELISKMSALGCENYIYDTFLDDETVSQIRKGSDIMIQVQISDQFSGSMQEHLFAENVVITGSWLPYETLKEYGAVFEEIDEVSDLATILPKVILNYRELQSKGQDNANAVLQLSSWERNINSWIDLYN